jgi:L-serine deaminase
MANGTGPILNLPGTLGSSGGLRVTGDTGSASGGGTAPIANIVGTTATGADGRPTLLVIFV